MRVLSRKLYVAQPHLLLILCEHDSDFATVSEVVAMIGLALNTPQVVNGAP